ncbi:hypothetical protein H6B10_17110, partial [Gemmiger formicilis]|uniref:hypothetical protein n=1 Tax=Gemmiger formicilis TaxID=745368 RepID=UPI0019587B29
GSGCSFNSKSSCGAGAGSGATGVFCARKRCESDKWDSGSIPTLNGSFDVGQAASAAWQAGRPLSELLDAQPVT